MADNRAFVFRALPQVSHAVDSPIHYAIECPANDSPRPYVIAASRMPTTGVSSPLAQDGRVVTSAFEAPTAKCAIVLMMNDAMTAGMPTAKKNGTIGMKPPTAVEAAAEIVDLNGLGNVSSDNP